MVKPRAKARKLLTRFKIGKRVYELVPILKKGEKWVTDDEIFKRAKKFKASLGKDDGQFILKHQTKIPEEFRGKFLVFTAWRHPSYPQIVACLRWDGRRWFQSWLWLSFDWLMYGRLVRLVK